LFHGALLHLSRQLAEQPLPCMVKPGENSSCQNTRRAAQI